MLKRVEGFSFLRRERERPRKREIMRGAEFAKQKRKNSEFSKKKREKMERGRKHYED